MDFIIDTRGFRNNNPGNIKHGEDWRGLAERQIDDVFCTFRAVEWGIRAIHRILLTYKNAYDIVTIEQIIKRWAPAHENHTENYIDSVRDTVNRTVASYVSRTCDVWSRDLVTETIQGIIYFENGCNPFNKEFIEKCYGL